MSTDMKHRDGEGMPDDARDLQIKHALNALTEWLYWNKGNCGCHWHGYNHDAISLCNIHKAFATLGGKDENIVPPYDEKKVLAQVNKSIENENAINAKLEAANKMAVALKSAAGQFRIYEESHRAKSREEGASNEERSDRINKANVNAYCAERAEEVLAQYHTVNGAAKERGGKS